jgi:hypothetical protein
MFIIRYVYNKLFINNKKIELDNKINIEDEKKKKMIKYNICNNICDMKELSKDEMSTIKKMSHGSLLQLIGLLSNVNTNVISIMNDDHYNTLNTEKGNEKIDQIIDKEKT